MASGTIFLTVSALLYTLILTFIFFSKERETKLENKIFSELLITSLLSMITELLIVFTVNINEIGTIIQKLFLIFIVFWLSKFMSYTIIITSFEKYRDEEKNKKYKELCLISLIFNLLCAVIIMCLPIKFNDINGAKFTSGASVNFVFGITGIYMLITLVLIVKYLSKIKDKNFVPVIALVILLVLTAFIQSLNPQILLTNAVFGIVICLMYHTIENPDLKIIEELKKNRSLTSKSYIEKSNFLFRMSAEVRKPIENIKELNDYNLDSNDIKEIKENSKEIDLNLKNANFTINNVLDVTSLDTKNINITNNKYNIHKLLKEIKLRESKKINNIRFEFNISENLPEYLYGDSIRLKNILMCILDKSIERTNNGFIEVNVNSINKYDICRLIITIEDSSIPLSLEEINNILDNDKEIDENNITIYDINKLINMMNGNLMIKSEEGNEFLLSIDSKILNPKTEEITNDTDILFISNNNKLLKNLEILFNEYTSNSVLNGIDAIDLIRVGENYNLILIDDVMKPISGLETLKKLRSLDINIPCIIMLDNDKEHIKNHYIKDGFIDYILKDDLKNEINRITNKYL